MRSRFVHLEFFRLTKDHDYLGKKGQIIGLEVNMRPSGGPTPDMINFAYSTNCYQHYADMMVYDRLRHKSRSTPCFCAFVGRWRDVPYTHSHTEILCAFKEQLKAAEELPEILAHGMGNYIYLAKLENQEDIDEFFRYTLEVQTPDSDKTSLEEAALQHKPDIKKTN